MHSGSGLFTGYALSAPVCSVPRDPNEFTCMAYRRIDVPKGTPGAHRYTIPNALRGPRGGLIMCKEKYAKDIDSQAFPGIQGGPLMHVIAAKAVCFKEALSPAFKTYQQQIVKNAKSLAEEDIKFARIHWPAKRKGH